jgi:hypothetical protein
MTEINIFQEGEKTMAVKEKSTLSSLGTVRTFLKVGT